ncbi:type VI secretion system contractile sheath domain-containing protein [Leisingera caerulea]|uniref:type VI secretion system contractile sheath domain-containing protein n=1 Tax=Leisingera caerulea TaxID=506591 RepID=UPI0035CD0117
MPEAEDTEEASSVLDELVSIEVQEEDEDAAGTALESLAAADIEAPEAEDHADILEGLADLEPEEAEADDAAEAALGSLEPVAEAVEEDEDISGVLSDLADVEPEADEEGAKAAAALDSLADAELSEAEGDDGLDDVLGGLLEDSPAEEDAGSEAEDALESLASVDVEEADDDGSDDVLEGLLEGGLNEAEGTDEDLNAVLEGLEAPEAADSGETSGDVLAGLTDGLTEETAEEDSGLDSILDGLDAPEEADDSDDLSAALDTLDAPAEEDADDSGLDDLLGDLGDLGGDSVEEAAAEDDADVPEVLTAEEESLDDAEGGGLDLDLDALLDSGDETEATAGEDDLDSLLGDLTEEADASDDDDLDALLSGAEEEAGARDSGLDDLLGDLEAGEDAEADAAEADSSAALPPNDEDTEDAGGLENLDDLLGDLEEPGDEASEELADSGLDDLLGDLDSGEETGPEAAGDDDLDSLLGDLDAEDAGEAEDLSLDDLLGDLGGGEEDDGDLDDLLAGLGEEAEAEDAADAESGEEDLDALLDGLGDADADLDSLMGHDGGMDLDDLLGDLGGDDEAAEDAGGDDLDALLGDLDDGGGAAEAAAAVEASEEPEFAYGTMSADRPEPQKLERKRFRLAVLGDFSGRAAKGQLETGDALAARKAILLDPDTVEDVIERFATELVLPIGKEGAGIAVKLEDLDGLHPDELYENVELFTELAGLRKQLQSGATADHAAKTLRAWAEKYGTRARAPKRTSAGNAVPADKRLSAFQQLIKDTGITPRPATPVEELLARVVGPHIRALPDPDVAAMQKAVDEALSDAMRLVLHHPEFQSVEAQWRSLDLMARSIEADDTLDVMLYDISAEELAADLAAEEDLSKTGFVRLLTEEPLDEENGRGGYSALIGMYQFEETPPHAELLGRIARVAAHVDAPFFASISPEFLKTPKAERPKVVAEAWDTLQGMAEAGHLGLVSPRFLLRRPYGEKTEPCYEFDFEEFTETEGLKGMLWANPVVLVAILLARSFKENGPSLQLGRIMSLGGMPYHYVNDRFGDQVALPCTERNVDLGKIALAQERGFMAVSAVKGRDEVRLTSFNSLKGSEILGPWTGLPAPEPSPPDPRGLPKPAAPAGGGDEDDLDLGGDDGDDSGLDDLNLDDLDLGGDGEDDLDLGELDFDADDGGLDDLLASFGDDDDEDDDDGDEEMDAELAALLDDL